MKVELKRIKACRLYQASGGSPAYTQVRVNGKVVDTYLVHARAIAKKKQYEKQYEQLQLFSK